MATGHFSIMVDPQIVTYCRFHAVDWSFVTTLCSHNTEPEMTFNIATVPNKAGKPAILL